MQTNTVMASQLGDDWRPSAHTPRLLTQAQNVRTGDRIRVRDHSSTNEGERVWHTVTVEDAEDGIRSMVTLKTDKWPIAYMCFFEDLVELVEITRTVNLRCVTCRQSQEVTVTLHDFLDANLMHRGGLHTAVINPTPEDITGYCTEHATSLLS